MNIFKQLKSQYSDNIKFLEELSKKLTKEDLDKLIYNDEFNKFFNKDYDNVANFTYYLYKEDKDKLAEEFLDNFVFEEFRNISLIYIIRKFIENNNIEKGIDILKDNQIVIPKDELENILSIHYNKLNGDIDPINALLINQLIEVNDYNEKKSYINEEKNFELMSKSIELNNYVDELSKIVLFNEIKTIDDIKKCEDLIDKSYKLLNYFKNNNYYSKEELKDMEYTLKLADVYQLNILKYIEQKINVKSNNNIKEV